MSRERDLEKLVASMSPVLMEGEYVFCTSHAHIFVQKDLVDPLTVNLGTGLCRGFAVFSANRQYQATSSVCAGRFLRDYWCRHWYIGTW